MTDRARAAGNGDRPYIKTEEFVAVGYLHEANRLLLHPLGLALEVITDPRGHPLRLGGVWDERTDPEGIVMDPTILSPEKAAAVDLRWSQRFDARHRRLGHMVQPAFEGQDTTAWNSLTGTGADLALAQIGAIIEEGVIVAGSPVDRIARIIAGWRPEHAVATRRRVPA